jgi:hypothetical protein
MDHSLLLEDPVVVAVFDYPARAATAVAVLETNGIRCERVDSLIVEANHFLSQAVGGIKLKVSRRDYDQAFRLLSEGGFIHPEPTGESMVDRVIQSGAFRKAIKVVVYLVLAVVSVFLALWFWFAVIKRPSVADILNGKQWCLGAMEYNDELYYPHTFTGDVGFHINPAFVCTEKMKFYSDGVLEIPGFQCRPIRTQWSIMGSVLTISGADTLSRVFDGSYEVEINRQEISIVSPNTAFYMFDTMLD